MGVDMKEENKEIEAAETSPLASGKWSWEPFVKVSYLREHFGMSRTTVWRAVKQGMPVLRKGRTLRRYRISDVQRWLEENGRERFADNGRTSTVRDLRALIDRDPTMEGIDVVTMGKRQKPNHKTK